MGFQVRCTEETLLAEHFMLTPAKLLLDSLLICHSFFLSDCLRGLPPNSETLPGRPSFAPNPLVAGLPATLNFGTFPGEECNQRKCLEHITQH